MWSLNQLRSIVGLIKPKTGPFLKHDWCRICQNNFGRWAEQTIYDQLDSWQRGCEDCQKNSELGRPSQTFLTSEAWHLLKHSGRIVFSLHFNITELIHSMLFCLLMFSSSQWFMNAGRRTLAGCHCKPFLLLFAPKRQGWSNRTLGFVVPFWNGSVSCTRDLITKYNSFQTLSDIPEHYECDEGNNHRRARHPQDVFCLVKEYISSADLRQRPLLVLTHESRATFALTTQSHLFTLQPMFWFHLLLKGGE